MAIKKANPVKKDEINYTVLEECGTVQERKGGYELKLRYISWNDRDPVYDLRPWKVTDEGNEVCGKGITLSGEELENLGNIITGMMEED